MSPTGGPGSTPGPLRVPEPAVVELIRVRIPLVVPFTTATSHTAVKDALLVRVETEDGVVGWGECGAQATPEYSTETIDVAAEALRRGGPRPNFARAAFDAAILDAGLKAQGTSLAQHLGVTRTRVPAGVAIGIADDVVAAAVAYAERGYRRIKLKISPSVSFDQVRDVRTAIGPDIALQVDANESFTLADAPHLATLAEYDVQCIEQPLPRAELAEHCELAHEIATPICLDETVVDEDTGKLAVELGFIVNIKPGRVGGLATARWIHDECVDYQRDALCGGMLETGIGRAVNVALAALPGFTLIGDLSASDRYFAEDLTDPFVLEDGHLRVPTGPGIGVTVHEEIVGRYTVSRERL